MCYDLFLGSCVHMLIIVHNGVCVLQTLLRVAKNLFTHLGQCHTCVLVYKVIVSVVRCG
jgi:hypothetical protein